MSFHGINNLYNNIQVDGANANDNYNGGARGGTADGYVYSSDSVREFQVSSTGFNAEVGQSAGGSVNTVTKSGSNQFHGDLFYSGRSNAFNAIDPVNAANALAKGTTPTQNVHQQDQYGGSGGGPLWHDKLFLFTTVDQYRKVYPLTTTTNQLNPTIQQLTCPTGAAAPTAAQCQAAKNFINTGLVGTFPQNLWQDVELIKLDGQVNASNHISMVTDWRDRRNHIDPSDINNVTPNAFNQDRSATATWTTVIGSNKVNEGRYQYSESNSFSSLNPNQGAPGVALSGIVTYGNAGGGDSWTKEFRNQFSDNFSWTKGNHSFKFGADINLITDDARSANNSGGLYQYTNGNAIPGISCAAPAVGAFPATSQSSANTQNLIFCDWLMDLYGKNAGDSKTGQHFDTYNQFFDMLYSSFPNSFHYLIPDRDYSGFVQDTWKLRPNITVNIGLRYDNQQLPVLPNAPALHITGTPTLPAGSVDLPIYDTYTTTYPSQNDAIQPRFGIAWNIAKDTVVRFGGGTFIAKTEGHNVKNAFAGAGETTTNCSSTSTGLAATCPATGTPLTFPNVYFNQQDGLLFTPVLPGAVSTVAVDAPSVLTIPTPTFGIRGVDPTQKRPTVYTMDAAVEQRLPGNLNLSVSYVYTKGIRLPRGRDFNIGPDTSDAQVCSTILSGGTQNCGYVPEKSYDVVDANGNTVISSTVPFFSQQVNSSGAVVCTTATCGTGVDYNPIYSARVNPVTGVINGNMSTSYSQYDGMIVALRKPISHGLEVQANYTLSLSKDSGEQGASTNQGEGQVGLTNIDPYNDKAEWGNSATDVRNRFVTSVVYAPSFERLVSGNVGKELLGGWSLSSSITAQNGGHYTALTSGSTTKNLTVTGCTVGQASGACSTVFNFAPLDGGLSGVSITSPGANNSSRLTWLPNGSFVMPNLYNVDMRLEKQFSIKERYHIAIRGEAFNVFNSTLVQNVSMAAYSIAAPSASSTSCPSLRHTNSCLVPVSAFQTATVTSGNNLGARQLQAALRFEF